MDAFSLGKLYYILFYKLLILIKEHLLNFIF